MARGTAEQTMLRTSVTIKPTVLKSEFAGRPYLITAHSTLLGPDRAMAGLWEVLSPQGFSCANSRGGNLVPIPT